MQPTRTIVVKLRANTPVAEGRERIRQVLVGELVRQAEPLFPDEKESELASLFEVTLEPAASLTQALAALENDEQVEYAHCPETRHPV